MSGGVGGGSREASPYPDLRHKEMPKSEQRIDPDRYQVTPRTLIFLFNTKDQVLLLRGAANKRLWAGLFNGVGGHVEAGEDILESAQRELFEETGIQGIPLYFCGQIMIDVDPGMGVGVFVFCGAYEGQYLQHSEEGVLAWVDLDGLDQLPLVGDLPLLIPKIASFQPGDPPLIGKYTYDSEGKLQISFR
jgi:8-oxo-dGTP diphosphatase